MDQIIILLSFLGLGYIFGYLNESRHYTSIRRREEQFLSLPAVNIKIVEKTSREIEKAVLVQGNAVISIDYFKRFLAGLHNIFGGSVGSYESLVDRARREAILRMKEAAGDADIIVNTRIDTSPIGQSINQRTVGSVEAIAYGTAVTYGPRSTLLHDDDMKRKAGRSPTLLPVFFLLLSLIRPFPVEAATPACGELVINKCTSCHFETRICHKIKKRKGKGSWKRTITSMVRHGAVIDKDEQHRLLVCLSKPADGEVLELCGMKK